MAVDGWAMQVMTSAKNLCWKNRRNRKIVLYINRNEDPESKWDLNVINLTTKENLLKERFKLKKYAIEFATKWMEEHI